MTLNDCLAEILKLHGIDPDQSVPIDDGGERTAFEILEAAVFGALDAIEEHQAS